MCVCVCVCVCVQELIHNCTLSLHLDTTILFVHKYNYTLVQYHAIIQY